jgi:hypothetical protein
MGPICRPGPPVRSQATKPNGKRAVTGLPFGHMRSADRIVGPVRRSNSSAPRYACPALRPSTSQEPTVLSHPATSVAARSQTQQALQTLNAFTGLTECDRAAARSEFILRSSRLKTLSPRRKVDGVIATANLLIPALAPNRGCSRRRFVLTTGGHPALH